jgi:Leucine-rich repeat (LRR) protein
VILVKILSQLTFLSISHIQNITRESFKAIADNLKQLTDLDLDYTQISDDSLKF